MADIMSMIGKDVEVIANGMAYKGKLLEVSETEVHIKTLLQWLALPASSVSEIKLAETAMKGGLGNTFPPEVPAEDIEEIHDIEDLHEIDDPET